MDVEKILQTLESHQLIRTNKITGNWFTVYCPFHNDGNERKPSCGVLLKDEYRNGKKYPQGLWHCFSCSTVKSMPDAVTYILKQKNIQSDGLKWLSENVPGFEIDADFDYLIPPDMMQSLSNKYAIDYIQTSLNKSSQSFVSEDELKNYRFTVPYMYERGLTDEIIEKFDVGVDLNWIPPGRKKKVPCITFPIRDANGRTLFLCRRSIEGKLYNYPEDVIKPVYGIDMIPRGCSSLIICESIINALTCWKWGYPAVALLGTGNPYQMQQLRELGIPEFTLCMDGDDAGKRATRRLKNNLNKNAIIWTIHMLDGKDVNDIDKQTFDRLYQERD